MPFGLGFGELVLIFAVLLMLFGAKRLPEVAQGMGKGIRDFKRAVNGLDDQTLQATPAPAPQVAAPAAPVATTPAPVEARQIEQ
jgi:sec-independent protein translocase protein TatA